MPRFIFINRKDGWNLIELICQTMMPFSCVLGEMAENTYLMYRVQGWLEGMTCGSGLCSQEEDQSGRTFWYALMF